MSVFFRVAYLSVLFLGILPVPSLAGDPAFEIHDDPPHEAGIPPEVPRISLGLSLGWEAPNNEFRDGGPEVRESWGASLRLGTSGRSHLAFAGRFLDYYYTPLILETIPVDEMRTDMQIYELMYGWNFHGGLIPGSRLVLEVGPSLVRITPSPGGSMNAGVSAHLGWPIPLGEHVDLEPRLSLLAMVLVEDQDWPMLASAHLGIRVH